MTHRINVLTVLLTGALIAAPGISAAQTNHGSPDMREWPCVIIQQAGERTNDSTTNRRNARMQGWVDGYYEAIQVVFEEQLGAMFTLAGPDGFQAMIENQCAAMVPTGPASNQTNLGQATQAVIEALTNE